MRQTLSCLRVSRASLPKPLGGGVLNGTCLVVVEAGVEAGADVEGGAGVAVVAGDDAVVALEAELDGVALFGLDGVRVEAVALGRDGVRLGLGEAGQGGGGEELLDGEHGDITITVYVCPDGFSERSK